MASQHDPALTNPHAETEDATLEVPDKSPSTDKRSFQIKLARRDGKEGEEYVVEGKNRYVSKNPAGAARKAASRVFRECYKGVDEPCKIYIAIRETTKDSKKSEYAYIATRSKRSEEQACEFKSKATADGDDTEAITKVGFKYNVTLKAEREPKPPKVSKRAKTAVAATESPSPTASQ